MPHLTASIGLLYTSAFVRHHSCNSPLKVKAGVFCIASHGIWYDYGRRTYSQVATRHPCTSHVQQGSLDASVLPGRPPVVKLGVHERRASIASKASEGSSGGNAPEENNGYSVAAEDLGGMREVRNPPTDSPFASNFPANSGSQPEAARHVPPKLEMPSHAQDVTQEDNDTKISNRDVDLSNDVDKDQLPPQQQAWEKQDVKEEMQQRQQQQADRMSDMQQGTGQVPEEQQGEMALETGEAAGKPEALKTYSSSLEGYEGDNEE